MGFFILKIMWFLIISFGAYFVYALFFKNSNDEEEKKEQNQEDDWGAF